MLEKKCKPLPQNWKKDFQNLVVIKEKKISSLKTIGSRKKKQLQLGSQKNLFEKVWKYRKHFCEICKKNIPEPLSFCFAHRLSKGRYPEFIFENRNISLVCSIDCHQKLDHILSHHDNEIKDHILHRNPAIFRNLLEKLKK